MSSPSKFPRTGEELALRADASAEAHLANSLAAIYAGTDERFDDEEIGALRETFKLGWMEGYRACLDEIQADVRRRLESA